MKKIFILEDLDCAHCAGKIEEEIKALPTVTKAALTFVTRKLVVEADEDSMGAIVANVKKIVKKFEPDVTVTEK